MKLLARFPRSVVALTRVSALFALLGLGTFALGLFVPKPLPVILSMSVGHGLGLIGVLLYALAIAIDAAGTEERESTEAPVKDASSSHE